MVKDLEAFLAKVQEDKALQEKMLGIIKASTPENSFESCNAVAAGLGYTITREDLQALADKHKADLSDTELDKVAGGTDILVTIALGSAVGSLLAVSYAKSK